MPSSLPDELKSLLAEVVKKYHPKLIGPLLSDELEPLTPQECADIRLSLGTELSATGLQQDEEPNERGLQIEQLIDWLGRRHGSNWPR